jgi:hypothetical protein
MFWTDSILFCLKFSLFQVSVIERTLNLNLKQTFLNSSLTQTNGFSLKFRWCKKWFSHLQNPQFYNSFGNHRNTLRISSWKFSVFFWNFSTKTSTVCPMNSLAKPACFVVNRQFPAIFLLSEVSSGQLKWCTKTHKDWQLSSR